MNIWRRTSDDRTFESFGGKARICISVHRISYVFRSHRFRSLFIERYRITTCTVQSPMWDTSSRLVVIFGMHNNDD